eukprot:gnl/TRDRNA2_/TRDRNA2_153602_c2_seq1.p1 gnl/TRDRNA2_/TRDRNA2_153602_c2~~gnl/TRDRNA2_/TRDRNA2_153602_c2_seq1.p1  ORF type:complete len:194 (-),score=28.81 gnl/TRDRNA2_/TRDRNA2_153602_c2_seq1:4-585(-)
MTSEAKKTSLASDKAAKSSFKGSGFWSSRYSSGSRQSHEVRASTESQPEPPTKPAPATQPPQPLEPPQPLKPPQPLEPTSGLPPIKSLQEFLEDLSSRMQLHLDEQMKAFSNLQERQVAALEDLLSQQTRSARSFESAVESMELASSRMRTAPANMNPIIAQSRPATADPYCLPVMRGCQMSPSQRTTALNAV